MSAPYITVSTDEELMYFGMTADEVKKYRKVEGLAAQEREAKARKDFEIREEEEERINRELLERFSRLTPHQANTFNSLVTKRAAIWVSYDHYRLACMEIAERGPQFAPPPSERKWYQFWKKQS